MNKKIKLTCIVLFATMTAFSTVNAADNQQDEMAEMQKRLNAEVMEKPFSVADEKKIDDYIKSSMKKDLQPEKKAPDFWRPGYSCADIYHYGWNYYRSCRYYRHYYGRYWF
ncbi:hypothetical protein [Aliikangiella maris]|uniref:Uncharacterized protein n=2 Tax=Aliikangiella maris TaxID=3162458 RepID=A0ABV2BRG6_9GAMM